MNDDLDIENGKLSAYDVHCARQRLARDHAALFPTRVALARWRSGALPHLHGGHPPLRSAWFGRLGREHQAWLDRGGFAQHDDAPGLRQPTMWHPPQLLTSTAPGQGTTVPPSPPDSCRSDRDGDARQCGTCT